MTLKRIIASLIYKQQRILLPLPEKPNNLNANLTGADLRGCNLVGVCFIGANLQGANLAGANVNFANFTAADLEGASLEYVFYNERTLWPVGFVLPESAIDVGMATRKEMSNIATDAGGFG